MVIAPPVLVKMADHAEMMIIYLYATVLGLDTLAQLVKRVCIYLWIDDIIYG